MTTIASTSPFALRTLAQHGLFPAALGLAGLAAYGLHAGALDPMAAQMGVFVAALVMVIGAERWLPFEERWRDRPPGETRLDAMSMAVLMAAVDPFLKLAVTPFVMTLTIALARPEGGLGLFPAHWPLGVQLPLAFLLAELCQYLAHRAAHRGGWMWRAHAFHHSPERIYWLNGFRVHPLNMAWHQLAGPVLLLALGAPATVVQMLLLFAVVISVFQHANADLRYDGWNRVFATADLHRWHHADTRVDGQCNFGPGLVVWDQLFGTYRRASTAGPVKLGIGQGPRPAGYLGWLAHPFRS